jgi:hypothetical protein
MEPGLDRTRRAEHLAFWSPLSLLELCTAVQKGLCLPNFEYDRENETEWGTAVSGGIEYNISRPYEEGTLQRWDSSVPSDCNIGVFLSVSRAPTEPRDADQSATEIVLLVGQVLADLFGQPIYHHRTWLGPGKNVNRTNIFRPRLRVP